MEKKKNYGDTVSLDEVVKMADNLVNNVNEYQLKLSFDIIDTQGSGRINKKTFLTHGQECWMAAFRNLDSLVQKTTLRNKVPSNSIETWAQDKKRDFLEKLGSEFNAYDYQQKNYWSYDDFKKWATNSKVNTVIAELSDIAVIIPMHLNMATLSRYTPEVNNNGY